MGGQELEINGARFFDNSNKDKIEVLICGKKSEVISSSYG